MFLGTSRIWWIAAAIPLVLGIALFVTGTGGTVGSVGGVLLILLGMVLFATAPMRYGRDKRGATPETTAAADTGESLPVDSTPRPRPAIAARDAADV